MFFRFSYLDDMSTPAHTEIFRDVRDGRFYVKDANLNHLGFDDICDFVEYFRKKEEEKEDKCEEEDADDIYAPMPVVAIQQKTNTKTKTNRTRTRPSLSASNLPAQQNTKSLRPTRTESGSKPNSKFDWKRDSGISSQSATSSSSFSSLVSSPSTASSSSSASSSKYGAGRSEHSSSGSNTVKNEASDHESGWPVEEEEEEDEDGDGSGDEYGKTLPLGIPTSEDPESGNEYDSTLPVAQIPLVYAQPKRNKGATFRSPKTKSASTSQLVLDKKAGPNRGPGNNLAPPPPGIRRRESRSPQPGENAQKDLPTPANGGGRRRNNQSPRLEDDPQKILLKTHWLDLYSYFTNNHPK